MRRAVLLVASILCLSWAGVAVSAPQVLAAGHAAASSLQAATPSPSWWSGNCDVNNHSGSYPLGASYNGVEACGPGPLQGGYDYLVHFYSGAWGEYEWECVELVMRYMYLVYGIAPYSANGSTVVSNYSGNKLVKVSNNGSSLPSPGDIVSEGAATKNGHTGVVTKVSVSSGTGTVTIMEQNATSNGWSSIPVSGNVLGSGVTGWLHHSAVQLISGKPVKATISTPGQKIKYTFAATANKHVTFQVTQFNFSDGTNPGGFYLDFYEPGNTSSYTSNYFGDNGYFDFTPPLTGTWTVKVVPYSSSVGSMTLTFANDVATQALTSGAPVITTIAFQGQHAGYTFAATANKHVTFQVTQFNFSDGTNPGGFYLDFYEPGNTSSYTSCYFGDNGSCDVTTPISGTWTVRLTPYSSSVGSMTLTMT